MRLAKYVAHAGVSSRRAAEVLIGEGRVTVAGKIVRDPAFDVDERSAVQVDGRLLSGPEPRVIYALHKPIGVLSTASDPQGRPTVVELLSSERRLYPVGRLDRDSSGLILLTNDGTLAHRLSHPSFEVPKTYVVRLSSGQIGATALRRLRSGVKLQDGRTAPAQVRLLAPDTLEIELREGRNRQVRRMCEAVGHEVLELKRTRIGPVVLGRLKVGAHRRLSEPEVRMLAEGAGSGRIGGDEPTEQGRARPARRQQRRAQ